MREEFVPCLSCFALNEAGIDFCEKCGAPLGTTANLDPLKAIRTEGFLLEKATTAPKPKLIVLIGTWIMFFPALIMSLMLAGSQISDGFEAAGFIFFWSGVALSVFASVVLYRVTKNYLASSAAEND